MKAEHLSDEQFAEALLGAPSEAAAMHAAECAACRAELSRMSSTLGRMHQSARAAAEKPAGFWYTQRAAILEGLSARPQRSHLTAWASALATLVLAAVLLGQVSIEPGLLTANANGGSETAAKTDPDDELMLEIQASVRRPVPRAFEPALLVTQELHRAAEANQSRP